MYSNINVIFKRLIHSNISDCALLMHCTWQLSFTFGFSVHFGYPTHLKTSPVLTVHLGSNYNLLPLVPPPR